MYLTDAAFYDAVAVRQSLSGLGTALDAGKKKLADQCQREAYGQIVAILLGRTYTRAQIDAWPRGGEYERDIGLYWYWTHSGLGMNYDRAATDALDRRKELLTVADVAPPAPATGGVGRGPLDGSGLAFGRDRWRG